PAAGIAGAAVALRDFAELAQQPGFLREVFARAQAPDAQSAAELYRIADALMAGALLLLAASFAARPVRDFWERRAGVVHLAYDVVFLLNRYFRATGQAVQAAGGRLDKFIGDGVMAIFGLDREPDVACRQALDAARRMALALDDLNEAMSGDLDQPLRIGIGLHAGPAIVGEMGYDRAASLTAIGDTVNTASRLESLTKELKVELVVSQELLDKAGADLSAAPMHEVDIRGRQGKLVVRAVVQARDLTSLSS